MRVLFVDQYGELGGAQRCLLDLLPAASEAGWKVLVCAPSPGPLKDLARRYGAEAADAPLGAYSSGPKPLGQALRFGWESLRLIRVLEAQISRFRPVVLYANGPRALPAAALVARHCHLPLIFHCHHRLFDKPAIRLARRALEIGRARLISCCRFALAPLASAVAAERRHVVYNGVRGPDEPPPERAPVEPCIGVLGRIGPEKGQAEFLEAAREISRRGARCRFAICGAPLFGDPASQRYSDALKRSARDLPVEFTGWREDVYAVLRNWSIAVVPSIREPATTRVILEAYSCGVPVVASGTGGIPEVLEDGRTGLLVDVSRPGELAAKILELLGDDARRRQLAEDGRKEWVRRFSVERYQREVLSVIECSGGVKWLEGSRNERRLSASRAGELPS